TPNVNKAFSSFSSRRTILNKPDRSNIRFICGDTEQTTISPPNCNTSLYLPNITPSPELSINVTDFRFKRTCWTSFLYMVSFHSCRNDSDSWWSSSPNKRTIKTFSFASKIDVKPIYSPPSNILPFYFVIPQRYSCLPTKEEVIRHGFQSFFTICLIFRFHKVKNDALLITSSTMSYYYETISPSFLSNNV